MCVFCLKGLDNFSLADSDSDDDGNEDSDANNDVNEDSDANGDSNSNEDSNYNDADDVMEARLMLAAQLPSYESNADDSDPLGMDSYLD